MRTCSGCHFMLCLLFLALTDALVTCHMLDLDVLLCPNRNGTDRENQFHRPFRFFKTTHDGHPG